MSVPSSFESFSGSTVPSASSYDSTEPNQTDGLPDSFHAFQPPTNSVSRGPCPALNTLANHGYLPRDGRNITASDLCKVLQHADVYNISEQLAELLAFGGFAMMHHTPGASISLHELARHGYIEHDGSLVHKNTAEGHEYAPTECDSRLLEELLGGKEYLVLDAVAEQRAKIERASNYSICKVHREIARGEWALVMDVFGREHGGKVPSDFLRVWLKENRIPEGWRPTHEQGFSETLKTSLSIHGRMHHYRKKLEALERNGDSEEIKTEKELSSALTTTPEGAGAGETRGRESHTASPRPVKRQKTIPEIDI